MLLEKSNRRENISDNDLIDRFKSSGDIYHLGELFCRYVHLVYGVCLHQTGKRQVAQDACMGVFEKVFLLVRVADIDDFRSWLFGLSNSYCLLFNEEKGRIGFLKEKIGGNELLSFESPKEITSSYKSVWLYYENSNSSIDYEVSDDKRNVLNAFYKQEKCFDDLVELFGLSIAQIIAIVEVVPRQLLELFSNEQKMMLKGHVEHTRVRNWDAFLKYLTNEINGKEKNAFERSIIKHPFEISLLFGMVGYAGVSIDADLDVLKRRIHRRSGYEQQDNDLNINWRLVSIVVGLLLFLGLIFFLIVQYMQSEKEIKEVPRKVISVTQAPTSVKSDSLLDTITKPLVFTDDVEVEELPVVEKDEPKSEPKSESVEVKEEEKIEPKMFEKINADTDVTLKIKENVVPKLENVDTLSPVFVDLTPTSVLGMIDTINQESNYSPEGGVEKYRNYLKSGLEKNNMSVSGDLLFDILFDKDGKIDTVTIIEGFGTKEDEVLLKLIKSGSAWKGDSTKNLNEFVRVHKRITL